MSRNFKLFISAFLISFFFWGGFNFATGSLESFLFTEIYRSPSDLLLAQANLQKALQKSLEKEPPEITAKSAISIKIYESGNERVIFEKNPDQILPIASLTKLMTALVALEYYDPSLIIEISKKAVEQPEDFGQLRVGERLSVEDLLHTMLIESSNDSAYALTELINEQAFIDLMNIEARNLGLGNTHFADSSGYKSESRSTANDLAKFAKYLLKERPEIWQITAQPEYSLYDNQGVFHHQLSSTNEILEEFSQIIGGKTGYTFEANGCFILLLKDRRNENVFINVILGSKNRFGDMRKLIDYAN